MKVREQQAHQWACPESTASIFTTERRRPVHKIVDKFRATPLRDRHVRSSSHTGVCQRNETLILRASGGPAVVRRDLDFAKFPLRLHRSLAVEGIFPFTDRGQCGRSLVWFRYRLRIVCYNDLREWRECAACL